MENIRTKRAKKPNPKYADTDYETIAALRRPFKQAKLDRRRSYQSEKDTDTPSHDGTLNSSSASEEEEEDSNTNYNLQSDSKRSDTDEGIKIDVFDAGDNAIQISNGKISPVLIETKDLNNDEILPVAPGTLSTTTETSTTDPPIIENVSAVPLETEKVPTDKMMMTTILSNQVNLNKRLDKIEKQISTILEILHKKPPSSPAKGQSRQVSQSIQKRDDIRVKANLKKNTNK